MKKFLLPLLPSTGLALASAAPVALALLLGLGVTSAGCSDDETATPAGNGTGNGDGGGNGDGTGNGDGGGNGDGNGDAGSDSGDDTARCGTARDTLLGSIDSVSAGAVTVLDDTDGVKTIFIDASAGGINNQATNPWIYVNLETGSRVEVTDKTSATSTAWDLALKRPILYTNSGDGGPGQGGALFVDKDFDAVTAADAGTFTPESFFDDECNANTDAMGAVLTSFDGWYDYDLDTHATTPGDGTWLVKGGTGKLFKIEITSYSANPDGTEGTTTGRFTVKVAAL